MNTDTDSELLNSIMHTLTAMFENPDTYASNALSFEEQFITLFSLVAPYVLNVEAEEAVKGYYDYTNPRFNRIEGEDTATQPLEFDFVVKTIYNFYCEQFKTKMSHLEKSNLN